ncbi:DUF2911 domain-containing protein [Tenacibaculum sp. S7007]|uniref:DUF2911 domain-containing protein n=1 Tax=Tenacibaculum pelagium TaxID=2759527 RepID=A0A839AKT4_9FLAO|nr:DUF2911 domain-containing protein [Tenacibaculum pelagium]MBA6155097.1 DUF2911 domain-containing protein [Tenacibaculum pelagium]
MKKYIILLSLILSNAITAQLKIPQLSPTATITQNIGLTEVTINYSRPSVRNRVIFEKNALLPFNEIWRTGANTATKISFSNDINIQGDTLKKGNYSILSIPKLNSWEIRWYSYDSGNWNTYVDKTPLLTIDVNVKKVPQLIETFEISFQDITLKSASLVLQWEHTVLKIPLTINEKEKILNSIKKTLAGASSFDYYQAALYLHETKTMLPKALEYIKKVTKSKKALFFQVTREALILKDLGENKEAVKVAKRGLLLSKKAKNNDFIKLNNKIIKGLN